MGGLSPLANCVWTVPADSDKGKTNSLDARAPSRASVAWLRPRLFEVSAEERFGALLRVVSRVPWWAAHKADVAAMCGEFQR